MRRKGGANHRRTSSSGGHASRGGGAPRRACRKGAVFSVEMMMVISVLVPMMFALTEFSLLWSARHLMEAAAYEAARAAAMPAVDDDAREAAAIAAANTVLAKPRFQHDSDIGFRLVYFDPGMEYGQPVEVRLEMPMTTASPDLLAVIGISIEDDVLSGEAVTARQE